MSSTQGHTNINTTYTTIDISSILSEINRIADETYLRGVKEGHRIANMERAELLDKVLKRVKEHHYLLSDQINSTDYGMFTVGIEQVIEELKAEIEE